MTVTAGAEAAVSERASGRDSGEGPDGNRTFSGRFEIVRNVKGALSEHQARVAARGVESTDATVAPVPWGSAFTQFWVLRDGDPVGLLTVGYLNEESVEVGARFWNPKVVAGFFLSDFVEAVLERYRVVLVRCYRGHWRVKRLLQRGGFRLVKIDGDVEFHTVTRETFLGRGTSARGWEDHD